MKTALSLSFILSLFLAPAVSPAAGDDDAFGEALFFGRNYDHMHVVGPEGNVVQDQYGDVKVILCAPNQWMIYVDPNHCGRAQSRGEPCTEMPTRTTGPWAQTFARGNHYLTHHFSGQRQEIHSVGGGEYEIVVAPGEAPARIWEADRPLGKAELASYCER